MTDATVKCPYCGQPSHLAVCPTVKAIEYFADGMIKRVEFKTPSDYAIPIFPNPFYNTPFTVTFDSTERLS